MKRTFFFCFLATLALPFVCVAETPDDFLYKAKDYLARWQPDEAIAALEQCQALSTGDTAMVMTCLDYTAAAWCEKGDIFFFNEFGRQARDLWDEWKPDSDALIPWVSNSVDGCLTQILNWGSDQPEAEQQRVREQARQMMARTFGEQSEHYLSWLESL